jgi:hypothetical protein
MAALSIGFQLPQVSPQLADEPWVLLALLFRLVYSPILDVSPLPISEVVPSMSRVTAEPSAQDRCQAPSAHALSALLAGADF